MHDLSVVIPSRNEMFVAKTVQDILQHKEANTEVIVVLDGQWADPPIDQNADVTVLFHPVSIGQRAACNDGVKLADSKYIMKADAHCSFAQGFDRVLLEDIQDDWTIVPIMRNLWAFDWKCRKCGKRTYQGPTPEKCEVCGGTNLYRKIIWKAKENPQSTSYCFDSEPHFQYFNDFKKRPEGQGDLTETMSLQGSCFMLTKDKWFDLNICDEGFGSWGSQGIEVAAKTWLSGGRVMVDHKTYYAHLFRTQGGDFSFPYDMSQKQVNRSKKQCRELFFEGKWDKQIHSLSWLVEKFWPVPGWESIP
jgi:glycosyltransferase involved in cell wall biosynthesis